MTPVKGLLNYPAGCNPVEYPVVAGGSIAPALSNLHLLPSPPFLPIPGDVTRTSPKPCLPPGSKAPPSHGLPSVAPQSKHHRSPASLPAGHTVPGPGPGPGGPPQQASSGSFAARLQRESNESEPAPTRQVSPKTRGPPPLVRGSSPPPQDSQRKDRGLPHDGSRGSVSRPEDSQLYGARERAGVNVAVTEPQLLARSGFQPYRPEEARLGHPPAPPPPPTFTLDPAAAYNPYHPAAAAGLYPPHLQHAYRLEEQLYLERCGMLRPPLFPALPPSYHPLYGLRYSPDMLHSPLGLISPGLHERMKLEEEHRQRETQRMREEEKEREREQEREREKERRDKSRRSPRASPSHHQEAPARKAPIAGGRERAADPRKEPSPYPPPHLIVPGSIPNPTSVTLPPPLHPINSSLESGHAVTRLPYPSTSPHHTSPGHAIVPSHNTHTPPIMPSHNTHTPPIMPSHTTHTPSILTSHNTHTSPIISPHNPHTHASPIHSLVPHTVTSHTLHPLVPPQGNPPQLQQSSHRTSNPSGRGAVKDPPPAFVRPFEDNYSQQRRSPAVAFSPVKDRTSASVSVVDQQVDSSVSSAVPKQPNNHHQHHHGAPTLEPPSPSVTRKDSIFPQTRGPAVSLSKDINVRVTVSENGPVKLSLCPRVSEGHTQESPLVSNDSHSHHHQPQQKLTVAVAPSYHAAPLPVNSQPPSQTFPPQPYHLSSQQQQHQQPMFPFSVSSQLNHRQPSPTLINSSLPTSASQTPSEHGVANLINHQPSSTTTIPVVSSHQTTRQTTVVQAIQPVPAVVTFHQPPAVLNVPDAAKVAAVSAKEAAVPMSVWDYHYLSRSINSQRSTVGDCHSLAVSKLDLAECRRKNRRTNSLLNGTTASSDSDGEDSDCLVGSLWITKGPPAKLDAPPRKLRFLRMFGLTTLSRRNELELRKLERRRCPLVVAVEEAHSEGATPSPLDLPLPRYNPDQLSRTPDYKAKVRFLRSLGLECVARRDREDHELIWQTVIAERLRRNAVSSLVEYCRKVQLCTRGDPNTRDSPDLSERPRRVRLAFGIKRPASPDTLVVPGMNGLLRPSWLLSNGVKRLAVMEEDRGGEEEGPLRWPGLEAVMEAYHRYQQERSLEHRVLQDQCECLRNQLSARRREADTLDRRLRDLVATKSTQDYERHQTQRAIDHLNASLRQLRANFIVRLNMPQVRRYTNYKTTPTQASIEWASFAYEIGPFHSDLVTRNELRATVHSGIRQCWELLQSCGLAETSQLGPGWQARHDKGTIGTIVPDPELPKPRD
uniref:Genetic suppressor element-like domain-containing protein n=1 Tax=Timema bartmani TaxID=61472 RepID=A0A7R9ER84_9NEOP|nr:unnamed protein product [Timema bartmani]